VSDDISIPSPTYRVPRYSRGIDPTTRKLALFAAGFGGTLLLVVGGWTMLSHRGHGVPVVQADSAPLRVKPANPGGLQVAGAGNEIFSGGSDTDVEKLAPPPETPDPQGLRAAPPARPATGAVARATEPAARAPGVVGSAKSPPEPATAPAGAPPSGTLSPAAAQIVAALKPGNVGVTPQARPAEMPVRPAATPAVRPAETPAVRSAVAPAAAAEHGAGSKRALVQLAALTSEPAAKAEWDRLVKHWPDLFGGHQPSFSKTEHSGQVFWRVRTGGFDSVAQATAFCERLRAKGGGCSVADF
jgi:hypothetical protein